MFFYLYVGGFSVLGVPFWFAPAVPPEPENRWRDAPPDDEQAMLLGRNRRPSDHP
jgi:hypothetical protein